MKEVAETILRALWYGLEIAKLAVAIFMVTSIALVVVVLLALFFGVITGQLG